MSSLKGFVAKAWFMFLVIVVSLFALWGVDQLTSWNDDGMPNQDTSEATPALVTPTPPLTE